MKHDYVGTLTSVPTNDSNYTYALKKYATPEEIQQALDIMRNRDGKDKSRIAACERELRRRQKQQ